MMKLVALAAAAAVLTGASAASAAIYDFSITGASTDYHWQSASTLHSVDSGGDVFFTRPGNTNGYANLRTDNFGSGTGTALGLAGPGKPYLTIADNGTPIFSYSGYGFGGSRPADATFKLGTYTVATGYSGQTATFTVGVAEPATWAMLIAGFGLVGVAARRRTAAATA